MSSGDLASNQAAATLEDEWPGGDLGGKRERRFWVRAASAFYLLYAVGVLIPELLTSTSLELLRWSIYAGIVTLFAALSLILLRRAGQDFRVRMFALTGAVIALYFAPAALEIEDLAPGGVIALLFLTAVVRTGDFAVYIHLASLIPEPNPIVHRRQWFLPAHYAAAAVLSLISFFLLASDLPGFGSLIPPGWDDLADRIVGVRSAYAGLMMLVLLGSATRNSADLHGRRQAMICLIGVTPWTLSVLRQLFLPWTDSIPAFQISEWVVVLFVPISFFVALFGYHLFEIELAVRRSLIYGLTLGLIVSVVWVLLAEIGMVLSATVGRRPLIWILAVALIFAGAVLRPLIRKIGGAVDRTLFREKHELRLLEHSLIPELAGRRTIDSMSRYLVRRLRDVLGVERVVLLVADEEGEFFRPRAASDAQGGDLAQRAVFTREQLESMMGSRPSDPTVMPHEPAASPTAEVLIERMGVRVMVPMRFDQRLIAVLMLGGESSGRLDLDRDDLDRLHLIARQSSAMFENARLFELATTDGLTGLPRRTIFEERLRLEIQRASRAFQPFGVGLADIDRFKAINDSHGHLVGDQALRMIADALSSEARSTDLVARYGGEEFALLLPHADHEGLIGLGEELRASVASTRVTAGDQVIPVTISIGLVWVGSPEQLTGAEDLIRRADEALYRAKAEGRNRVVTV